MLCDHFALVAGGADSANDHAVLLERAAAAAGCDASACALRINRFDPAGLAVFRSLLVPLNRLSMLLLVPVVAPAPTFFPSGSGSPSL